jgi:multidrug efflux pump subunit AcrA (membrane-fusion protein)
VPTGTPALVEVDAFPGEKFQGRVSRVAPVFDPATRTAEIEIEVANASYRLKPGMYSRVNLTVDTRNDAITVPRNALVDLNGQNGVFVAHSGAQSGAPSGAPAAQGGENRGGQTGTSGGGGMTAKFVPVQVGIRSGEDIEIVKGVDDGARVITTGASALKDGDRIVAAGGEGRGGREGRGQGTGQKPQENGR